MALLILNKKTEALNRMQDAVLHLSAEQIAYSVRPDPQTAAGDRFASSGPVHRTNFRQATSIHLPRNPNGIADKVFGKDTSTNIVMLAKTRHP